MSIGIPVAENSEDSKKCTRDLRFQEILLVFTFRKTAETDFTIGAEVAARKRTHPIMKARKGDQSQKIRAR